MMNREPATLTEQQRVFVERSASTLPLNMRDEFVANVMKRLTGGEVSNYAVKAVVNLCLDAVPTFSCDET
jgi:hypothetical protein